MADKSSVHSKLDDCESCHFETADLTAYPVLWARDQVKWLCALCAGTRAGNIVGNPGRPYGDQGVVLQTICYVGNVILAALKER